MLLKQRGDKGTAACRAFDCTLVAVENMALDTPPLRQGQLTYQ